VIQFWFDADGRGFLFGAYPRLRLPTWVAMMLLVIIVFAPEVLICSHCSDSL
jgi:hypothetical protein